MRTWLVTLAIVLPLVAQTEDDFRKIFNAYNWTLRAQQYNATMAILTEEQIALYARVPPEQRPAFFGMTYRIPESYKVEYLRLSKDGRKATMLILCTFATPGKAEMTLQFVKQKDLWRMDRPIYGGDPDKRSRPADLEMGSRADYAASADTELQGPVLRLTKQNGGTVYVIRRDEEEIAVFVPMAKVSDDFVPGARISFRAAQHKSEKLKFWAESASLAD
jgi:hypothetical protein